jgi:hypothetical protein
MSHRKLKKHACLIISLRPQKLTRGRLYEFHWLEFTVPNWFWHEHCGLYMNGFFRMKLRLVRSRVPLVVTQEDHLQVVLAALHKNFTF